VVGILGLLGPVVTSLVALPKRFTHRRSILAFFGVVEFVSETIQILSLNNDVNGICTLSFAAERPANGVSWLALLKTWMDHDLAWAIVVSLSELLDVGRSAQVATTLVAVDVSPDGHISVVAARGNNGTSSSDFGDGVGANLGSRCSHSSGLKHSGHISQLQSVRKK